MNYIYKNYNDFITNCPDEESNGCSQEFLEEYYNGSIDAFIEANKTNKGCFNCRGCTNCRYCTNCTNCRYCLYCIECVDSTYRSDCWGCADCKDCDFIDDCSRTKERFSNDGKTKYI